MSEADRRGQGLTVVDPLSVLHALPSWLVLVVVGVTVLSESGFLLGMVLPGATGLLAAGVLAEQGIVPLWAMAVVGACAAVGGSQIGYLRGSRRGLRLPSRLVPVRERAARLLAATERWAPLLTQWVVGVRTVTWRLTGASGIPYRVFAAASIPAGLVWGSAMVVVGDLTAELYQEVADWLGWGSVILAAVVVAVVTVVVRMRRRAAAATATHA